MSNNLIATTTTTAAKAPTYSDIVVPEDVVFHGFPTGYEVSAPAAPEFRLGADHVVLNVDAEVADVGHVHLVILRQVILHAAEVVAPKRTDLAFEMRVLQRLLLQSIVEHVLVTKEEMGSVMTSGTGRVD